MRLVILMRISVIWNQGRVEVVCLKIEESYSSEDFLSTTQEMNAGKLHVLYHKARLITTFCCPKVEII